MESTKTGESKLPLAGALVTSSLGLALSALVAMPALAQPIDLGKTVISAAGFEQKIADAPASVSVVSQEELKSKPYSGLADALRDVEGIDVGSGFDKNGNMSITMRGLPADYTLVLINGRRQNDVGNIGPNNFGNSQFMYMPPLSAIERIEVVRGPMSTLYGSDAIGGVINVITKKVNPEWVGSLTSSVTLQQDSQYGDDKKLDFYLSGPLKTDLLGLTVRGGVYDRDHSEPTYSENLPLPEQDVNGDPNPPFWEDSGNFGDKKIVAARNWNLGSTLTFTPFENHDFVFDYDIAKQRYDNTSGETGTLDGAESLWLATNAGIIQPRVGYAPYQRVEREQFALSHTGRWSIGTLESSVTHLSSKNLGRSLPLTVAERQALQSTWDQAAAEQGTTGPELTPELATQLEGEYLPRPMRTLEVRNTTFDSRLDTQIGSHTLALGLQYIDAEMEDGVFGMDGAGFRDGAVQPHRQWAVFGEDHWGLRYDLTLTLGARYDDHNMFGGHVSPRVYLNWQAADAWTIKGGVSTGYIAPKPNDLYAGITGFGRQGVIPFVGTPDLQPETSLNYEVAAYYDNMEGIGVNITLFHNEFQDKIVNADQVPNCYGADSERELQNDCVDIGPGWYELGFTDFRQKINIDKAIAQGAEIGSRFEITPSIVVRANYTYTESEQKSGIEEGLPIIGTPEHMANATLSWQATQPLTLSLSAEARSDRFRGISEAGTSAETWDYYQSYELFHLAARYKVSDAVTLNARINNLLDNDLSSRTCNLNAEQNDYRCIADYNTNEQARSFWLSADLAF